MAIRFFSEGVNFIPKNKRILRCWVGDIILLHKNAIGDINIIFTSNAQILEINQKYLNHNYFTDIITFSYNQEDYISGDIFISIDTVKFNANYFSRPFLEELHRVIVHGILHLLGLNDHTVAEKKLMRDAEDESLLLLERNF